MKRQKVAMWTSVTVFVTGMVWYLVFVYYPGFLVPFIPSLDMDSDGLPIVTGVATFTILGFFLLFPICYLVVVCYGLYSLIMSTTGEEK